MGKYNTFALADDIMEPFRPLIDEKVFEIMQNYDEQELNTKIKADLLQVLNLTLYFKKRKESVDGCFAKNGEFFATMLYGKQKKK